MTRSSVEARTLSACKVFAKMLTENFYLKQIRDVSIARIYTTSFVKFSLSAQFMIFIEMNSFYTQFKIFIS